MCRTDTGRGQQGAALQWSAQSHRGLESVGRTLPHSRWGLCGDADTLTSDSASRTGLFEAS